jgi:hypothetical protein
MDEVSGRHMLIMFRYDYLHLAQFIQTNHNRKPRGLEGSTSACKVLDTAHHWRVTPRNDRSGWPAKTPEYLRHLRSVLVDVESVYRTSPFSRHFASAAAASRRCLSRNPSPRLQKNLGVLASFQKCDRRAC